MGKRSRKKKVTKALHRVKSTLIFYLALFALALAVANMNRPQVREEALKVVPKGGEPESVRPVKTKLAPPTIKSITVE